MTTQQQIDDPGQWRVGDDVRIEYRDGSVLTGKARREFYNELWVANVAIRYGNGDTRPDGIRCATVTVTRTVEPIPEPTVPWALVRFADDEVMYRDPTSKSSPWVETSSGEADRYTWNNAKEVYGAPVAVSLPHWSDEVDGLRARVEKLADEWERGYISHTHVGDGERPCETFYAHRAALAIAGVKIPPGMVVDHLCYVRTCVNLAHLEVVTPGENTARAWLRRTHCKHGHEFTAENTRIDRKGKRVCRTCARRHASESAARRAEGGEA